MTTTDYVFQNTGRAWPALCVLAPRQRVSRCRALVTGAAADEHNLNVVDCNASVTVARLSSISVTGGLGGTPSRRRVLRVTPLPLISITQYSILKGTREMVFRGLPRACWEFLEF